MAGARAAGAEAYRTLNRAFGSLLEEAQAAPQLLVALVEGAVLGGGFGLACVSDVAIAAADAQFGLPETSLGILPAQIAPFVVRRIGLTQARRLALTAARFDGREALRLGLVHFCEADADALEQRLEETLEQLRCAPNANAATKALLLASESGELGALLDDAARQFAEAVGGAEAAKAPWPSYRNASRSGPSEPRPRNRATASRSRTTCPASTRSSSPTAVKSPAGCCAPPMNWLPQRRRVQRGGRRRPPCATGRRGRVHRPGSGGAVLPEPRGDPDAARRSGTEAIHPATASSPRTPSSPVPAKPPGSSSSARMRKPST